MIEELSIVVLARDLPEHGLVEGDIGAVVHPYVGADVYEVEFVSGLGKNIAVVTLMAADIRLLEQHDILHARKLAS